MNDWHPSLPYLILAVICALASVAIACMSLAILSRNGGMVSDGGMYAVAAMAAAPAVLGIGIAAYMPSNRQ
jgi:hypothetical protein